MHARSDVRRGSTQYVRSRRVRAANRQTFPLEEPPAEGVRSDLIGWISEERLHTSYSDDKSRENRQPIFTIPTSNTTQDFSLPGRIARLYHGGLP